MTAYRAYRIDTNGHIALGEWIEAQDEAAARRLALALCDEATPTVELWQGPRQIAVLMCGEDQPTG